VPFKRHVGTFVAGSNIWSVCFGLQGIQAEKSDKLRANAIPTERLAPNGGTEFEEEDANCHYVRRS